MHLDHHAAGMVLLVLVSVKAPWTGLQQGNERERESSGEAKDSGECKIVPTESRPPMHFLHSVSC